MLKQFTSEDRLDLTDPAHTQLLRECLRNSRQGKGLLCDMIDSETEALEKWKTKGMQRSITMGVATIATAFIIIVLLLMEAPLS